MFKEPPTRLLGVAFCLVWNVLHFQKQWSRVRVSGVTPDKVCEMQLCSEPSLGQTASGWWTVRVAVLPMVIRVLQTTAEKVGTSGKHDSRAVQKRVYRWLGQPYGPDEQR